MSPEEWFRSQVVQVELVDIPEREYHAASHLGDDGWVTRSMITDWLRSPAGFELRYVRRDPLAQRPPPSASMRLGSYVDLLVTEGRDAFDSRYVAPPYQDVPAEWRTPSGAVSKARAVKERIALAIERGIVYREISETVAAWKAKAVERGVELRDEQLTEKAVYMAERLQENPLAAYYCQRATHRQAVVRVQLRCGVRIQVRVDLLATDIGVLADLKTTNKTRERFLKSAVTYGYHIQDWLYTQVADTLVDINHPMQFVCAMNDYPWDAYVVELPPEVRDWAGLQTRDAIEGIASASYGQLQKAAYVPYTELWLLNRIDQYGSDKELEGVP